MQDILISVMGKETMKNDQSKIFPETRTRETNFSAIYKRYAIPIYRYSSPELVTGQMLRISLLLFSWMR